MILSEELRAKIRRRAKRTWDKYLGAVECGETHRITEITEKSLHYRISGSLVGTELRMGPKITIRRDKIGRIYVPREI